MKRIVLACLIALIPTIALASTAAPVQPGSLETTGCSPSTITPCFVPYSITNPFPIYLSSSGGGIPTDKGGTITTGGTAQTAIALNAARKLAVCENPVSATEDLYVAIAGSATVNGAGNLADLAPGGSVSILGGTLVSVNAATLGHRFLCTEWQ